MRFVVDAMLGRLATWLRLTGQDTLYLHDCADGELLRLAREQERILLTSDGTLYEQATRQGITAMLVRGDVDNEIADVFRHFRIAPKVNPDTARCSKCNGRLIHLTGDQKERVNGLVPEQTYNYYDEFWLCEDCHSVYFKGSYWTNITSYMKRIAALIQENRDDQ